MEGAATRVLLVEDNPGDARLVEWTLSHEPGGRFLVERVARISAALERLAKDPVDAVLLDLGLPDSHGMRGLRGIREKFPEAAVVVLSGSEDRLLIREAVASGAQDYLVKGILPPGHLSRVLYAALHRQQVETRVLRGGLPEEALLSASSDRREGVAILRDGQATVVNDAFSKLIGIPREEIIEKPVWLSGIIDGSSDSPASNAAGSPEAPPGSVGAGQFDFDRPDGRRIELEYMVRRFPGRSGGGVLVWLRERASPSRAPLFRGDTGGRAVAGGSVAGAPGGPREGSLITGSSIDEASWAQLRELARRDPAFLPSLVDAFIAEGRRLVRRLEVAAERGDSLAMAQTAHNLKSSSAQVGALALAYRCGEVERSGAAGDLGETRMSVNRIVQDFPAVVDALSAKRRET
jgi:DNA-binding NarL/FixJ family response regulator/HPt (histidine-containing phosphotransfer) domain-containing protein